MSRIAAIVLAAGEFRRWGSDNKLLAPVGGVPMVARTAAAVLASTVRPVIVVLGHEAESVRRALAGMDISFDTAQDFSTGMAASLKTGIAAVPAEYDGALICLGDMPWVSPATFDRLADAFDPSAVTLALVPVYRGKRGNPVLLGRALFPEIAGLAGDRGARSLLASMPERVGEIAVDDPGVLRDADQPESLLDAGTSDDILAGISKRGI